MSYKDALEGQQRAAQEANSKIEAEKKAKLQELNRRATELENHIAANDPSAIGLTLEREDARISLDGQGFTIMLDPGLKQYHAMVLVPSRKGSPAPEIARGSRRQLTNLAEVDQYILSVVQSTKSN